MTLKHPKCLMGGWTTSPSGDATSWADPSNMRALTWSECSVLGNNLILPAELPQGIYALDRHDGAMNLDADRAQFRERSGEGFRLDVEPFCDQ